MGGGNPPGDRAHLTGLGGPPDKPPEELSSFASYLCLVYHEARNVRFLIKGDFREAGPYERVRSLPKDREAAWAEMQVLRLRASWSGTPAAARDVFAHQFRLTLEELVELYEDEHWKDAPRGGNLWAEITRSVIELGDALSRGDEGRAFELLGSMPNMHHNTGIVGDKLRELDASLGQGGS
jgi:hypothetical protein